MKKVSIIATLPSLEEARAKIVGILASPTQKLVSILLAPAKIANCARKNLKLIHRYNMADLNKIIDELSTLTVVEAAELSKQLEEKWGVTAAAPVAAAPAGGAAAPAGEKSEFSLFLSAGIKKLM